MISCSWIISFTVDALSPLFSDKWATKSLFSSFMVRTTSEVDMNSWWSWSYLGHFLFTWRYCGGKGYIWTHVRSRLMDWILDWHIKIQPNLVLLPGNCPQGDGLPVQARVPLVNRWEQSGQVGLLLKDQTQCELNYSLLEEKRGHD